MQSSKGKAVIPLKIIVVSVSVGQAEPIRRLCPTIRPGLTLGLAGDRSRDGARPESPERPRGDTANGPRRGIHKCSPPSIFCLTAPIGLQYRFERFWEEPFPA